MAPYFTKIENKSLDEKVAGSLDSKTEERVASAALQ